MSCSYVLFRRTMMNRLCKSKWQAGTAAEEQADEDTTEADDDAELAPATPDADEANAGYSGTGPLHALFTDTGFFLSSLVLRAASLTVLVMHTQTSMCMCCAGVHSDNSTSFNGKKDDILLSFRGDECVHRAMAAAVAAVAAGAADAGPPTAAAKKPKRSRQAQGTASGRQPVPALSF